MTIISIPDPGLGNTSYLVDLGDGSALVIDPARDPLPYLETAARLDVEIRHVAETHLHADFVSGARELVTLGATLIAPRGGALEHPHRPVDDEEEVAVGDLMLRVMATPGHTPEHVAYLLSDGPTPLTVFTGGTLMAGGVARPDLVSPESTVPLARSAYRSVRHLLAALPGEVEVRPTHGAGSFCSSGAASSNGASTIASERLIHPAANTDSEQEFVDTLLAGLGTYPTYFGRLRPVNQRGPEVYGPELIALAPVEGDELDGKTVVDVRPIDRFAAGHIPDSISIELRDQFGTWLGWLFEPDEPIVFVTDEEQDERELVRQALNVGHESLAGRISIDRWVAAGLPLSTIDLIRADRIPADAPLLDVRQRSEWDAGHVPGAINVELGALESGQIDLAPGTVVHCGHGQRAMTAASLLAGRGLDGLAATTDGVAAITKALATS